MTGEPVSGDLHLHCDLVRQAVEAERKRFLKALVIAKNNAMRLNDFPSGTALRDCHDAIAASADPPPEEQVTVGKVMEKLYERGMAKAQWSEVEADLIHLVQAQARLDAEMIRDDSPSCADLILKAAGLE